MKYTYKKVLSKFKVVDVTLDLFDNKSPENFTFDETDFGNLINVDTIRISNISLTCVVFNGDGEEIGSISMQEGIQSVQIGNIKVGYNRFTPFNMSLNETSCVVIFSQPTPPNTSAINGGIWFINGLAASEEDELFFRYDCYLTLEYL